MAAPIHILVRQRWWWAVSAVLAVLCALTETVFTRRVPTLLWPGLAALVINLIWTFGVAPVLDSRNVSPNGVVVPKAHLRALCVLVWVPTLLLTLSLLLVHFMLPFIDYMASDKWFWGWRWLGSRQLVPVLIAMAGIAIALTMCIRQRFYRAVEQLGICYQCGYPFTGVSSARCPECGTTAPWRTQAATALP